MDMIKEILCINGYDTCKEKCCDKLNCLYATAYRGYCVYGAHCKSMGCGRKKCYYNHIGEIK